MKDIKNYEGLYAITEDGQVWSYKSNKFISQEIGHRGYLRVNLSKNGKVKHFRVNRLVAQAYIPNPEDKPEVDHKDLDIKNNKVSNLRWATSSENKQNMRKGIKRNHSKILCVETGHIYKSQAEAARQTGIHPYCINCCVNGQQKTAGGYHWVRYYEDKRD